jgi:hypothetical protein
MVYLKSVICVTGDPPLPSPRGLNHLDAMAEFPLRDCFDRPPGASDGTVCNVSSVGREPAVLARFVVGNFNRPALRSIKTSKAEKKLPTRKQIDKSNRPSMSPRSTPVVQYEINPNSARRISAQQMAKSTRFVFW